MKFSLASDIHLEFGHLDLSNSEKSEVLILAGDILVANDFKAKSKRVEVYHRFLEEVTSRYDHVVYVMGNHEHYHGDYAKTADILQEEFKYFTNFKFLNNSHVDICDVRFMGGTLWTDFNKMDPLSLQNIKHKMNDFNVIENSNVQVSFRSKDSDSNVIFKERNSRFSPQDAYEEHKLFLESIDESLSSNLDDKKVIVVGHHLPTYHSVPDEYKRDYHGNAGYASDLSEFILNRNRIQYWIHGHTHTACDYMVGSSRVICNPRGYHGYEASAQNFRIAQYSI